MGSAFSAARTPPLRLKATAIAFLAYYRDRPDEISLGLYLWNGLKPRGLNYDLDAQLNQSLDSALEFFRKALRDIGRLSEPEVRIEASALFAFLIGTLVVHQTGRLRMLGTDIDRITNAHLGALASRLAILSERK